MIISRFISLAACQLDSLNFSDNHIIDSFCNVNKCSPQQRNELKSSIVIPPNFGELDDKKDSLDKARLALKVKEIDIFQKTIAVQELAQRKEQLVFFNKQVPEDYYHENYRDSLDVNWTQTNGWAIKHNTIGRRSVLSADNMSGESNDYLQILLTKPISCDQGLTSFDVLVESGSAGIRFMSPKEIYSVLIDSGTSSLLVGSSAYGDRDTELEVLENKNFLRAPAWQSVVLEWRDKNMTVIVNKQKVASVSLPYLYGTCNVGLYSNTDSVSFDKIVFTRLPSLLKNEFIASRQRGIQQLDVEEPAKVPKDSSESNVPEENEEVHLTPHKGTVFDGGLSALPRDNNLSHVARKAVLSLGNFFMNDISPNSEHLCQGYDILRPSKNNFNMCETSTVNALNDFILTESLTDPVLCTLKNFNCHSFTLHQVILLNKRAGVIAASDKRAIMIELVADTQSASVRYKYQDVIKHSSIRLQSSLSGRVDLVLNIHDINDGVKKVIVSINDHNVYEFVMEDADDLTETFHVGLFTIVGENSFNRLQIDTHT